MHLYYGLREFEGELFVRLKVSTNVAYMCPEFFKRYRAKAI